MLLQPLDWAIVAVYFLISLVIGVAVTKRAGSSATEYFAAGRSMPWWLLGVSMVATTFSTDTPNLVTNLVRQNGVSGNWTWWAFLFTGMLTVFLYARLWKRSGVLTDIEFYELRYSGKSAAFLRGFRALYLGVLFNIIVMASVSLAAIKICRVLLNMDPVTTILLGTVVTVIYSMLGGLQGVLITDFFQFFLAMIGSVAAAIVALHRPEVGGLANLFQHEEVRGSLSMLPALDKPDVLLTIFIIPLAVQWWASYYPGAEPGGGGYIAQRMLAAKDEKHALGAAFLFNAAHYALRPWPWIIVALCSMVVFPTLDSMKAAFPHAADLIKDDIGYPAMLTFMPVGLMGLIVASLMAAYMSTIATHLNWGSSYIVNDFYRRFLRPDSSDRELVFVGRVSTLLLMVAAGFVSLQMESALDNFQILVQIGAGTGLIYILRWFWWRLNAISEIVALVVSFLIALYFRFLHERLGLPALPEWQQLCIGVGVTTLFWLAATYLTRPTNPDTLVRFYRLVQPGGPGWKAVIRDAEARGIPMGDVDRLGQMPLGIVCMLLGCVSIYSALFATGYWIYGKTTAAALLTALFAVSAFVLVRLWIRLVHPLRIQMTITAKTE